MADRKKKTARTAGKKAAAPRAKPRKAAGGAAPRARKAAAPARKGEAAAAPARPPAARAAGARAGAVEAERARKPGPRARGLAARPRPSDEPDPESYFVARVRGEEAAREAPRPMTEAAVEAARGAPRGERPEPRGAWDEQLGDLPWSYGDDALVALPRDPRTLYLYWDHAAETLRRGWEGLQGGRSELWIFADLPGGGWERVRVVGFALESRGWYVHDLDPGRVYRAEIHLVDRDQDRLLPRPSNAVMLPPVGPSPVVDDRFARILWSEHLARWLAQWRAGGPFAEDLRAQLLRLSDWSRFGAGTWGGSAGGMGGRPSSPSGPPGSPSSPWGGAREP
jgi:hypothetical protein